MGDTRIGSVWRRWDLHVHPPGTKLSNAYGNVSSEGDDRFVNLLHKSPVDVFGITDYFSCDRSFAIIDHYRKQYPDSDKAFFVNIELRLSDAISSQNDSPDLHVVFDSEANACPRSKLVMFLRELKTHGSEPSGAKIACADLAAEAHYKAASVSFGDVKEALERVFGEDKPYLLVFPAGNNGMRSTHAGSPRKVVIADNIDKGCDCFFGKNESRNYFLRRDRYANGPSEPKPVIWGSDAHSFEDLERLSGQVPDWPHTWIKADKTFRGLLQICYEPEARVFIGDEPPAETRRRRHPTKVLQTLRINQLPTYSGANGRWFKNIELPLNPELTAIIGNKGSGKSALVDILGLLGDSRLEDYFAFLSNSSGNRKFRQKGFAENFGAEMEWQSGGKAIKTLNQPADTAMPEAVRYLPQNYFEKLTNEIQIGSFRTQIEDVVFSHVEATEQMGQGSFKELLELKTLQSKDETSALKGKLRAKNVEIVELEAKAEPAYVQTLQAQLNAKAAELAAIVDPAVVTAPSGVETPEQAALSTAAAECAAELSDLGQREDATTQGVSDQKRKRAQVTAILEALENLSKRVSETVETLRPKLAEFGFDVADVVSVELKDEQLKALRTTYTTEIAALESDNDLSDEKLEDLTNLVSLPDLKAAIAHRTERLSQLRQQLGAPQREYQNYLSQLEIAKRQRETIQGSDTDPNPGTIRHLQAAIADVRDKLPKQISDAKADRITLMREIYASKNRILAFYRNLKASVDSRLASVAIPDFQVEIDASFMLKSDFPETFLAKVAKNKRGPFNGMTNPPQQTLSDFLSSIDWNDIESIVSGLETILAAMQADGFRFGDQVADPKEFYNLLFSLDFIEASYQLRLGGKDLEELSPGEKGLLLLIFYLQLDKDDIPLVIDQPEDNLDNESIFKVLAECIRNAKKTRQVILVTHNPNLAVGADAEQIVCVSLEKANDYRFTFQSGAIENPAINDRIVLILEGSQPAFVKRRLKYQM